MSLSIPARPTTYKGIEMRSRLEATVAANLDLWGYDWAYERKAYADGRTQYLPDFELFTDGRLGAVIEVKGADPDDIRAVFDRMGVIWASDPDVMLVLIVAQWVTDGTWRDHGAPQATLILMLQGISKLFTGAFVLCPCGTVGLRATRKGGIEGTCRGCGTSRDPVAYLDPTERR